MHSNKNRNKEIFSIYNYVKDLKYLEVNLAKNKRVRPPTENYKI